MKIIKANEKHLDSIFELVQNTILAVYPNYYPISAVEFFCKHHNREAIRLDINKGNVQVLFEGNKLIGTGSHSGNSITRVFVSPDLQIKGYGTYVMQQLEDELSQKYAKAILDASLPAGQFYEKRGYKTIKHEKIMTDNGAVLTYEIMEKELGR